MTDTMLFGIWGVVGWLVVLFFCLAQLRRRP